MGIYRPIHIHIHIHIYTCVVSNFTDKCNNAEINFFKIISFFSSSDSTLQHVCTLEAFCISQSFATFALSHNSHGFGNPACDCHHSSCCQDCLRGSFLGGNLLSCGHHCSGFEINFVLTFSLPAMEEPLPGLDVPFRLSFKSRSSICGPVGFLPKMNLFCTKLGQVERTLFNASLALCLIFNGGWVVHMMGGSHVKWWPQKRKWIAWNLVYLTFPISSPNHKILDLTYLIVHQECLVPSMA